MKKDIGKKAIVASVFLAMLLLLSAAGLTTLAAETESATLLIEVENDEQLQSLRDNGMLLVDYDNGMALIEVPKAQLNAYRDNYNTRMDESRYEISLWNSGHTIDRRQGMPDIPAELRASDLSGIQPYVVQFIGPLPSSEWKDMVTDAGADIQGDLGNYAVLVRMDAASRNRVEQLDIVEWTGVYHPAFRVSQDLAEAEGALEISVKPWDGINLNYLSTQLDELGVTVGRIDNNRVVATIDADNLPAVAALDSVYMVEEYSRYTTFDNMANQIHEVQGVWFTSWSGLPVRLLGAGQVVGMMDTGFDGGWDNEGHPDFFGGPGGDRVVRYADREGGSDPDGENSAVAHGTHCAGIIAGNGWAWRTQMAVDGDYGGNPNTDRDYHIGEATGAAPEASLSMDGCTDGRGGFFPRLGYMNDQEADGARTFSNSWGTIDQSGYTGASTDLDNMLDGGMTHAYENVIVFAAGNDGPEEATIGAQSSAKNVFTVGASENYRPEWHSAENPGNVAEFSSRGGGEAGRIKPDILAVGTAQISAFGFGEWNYYESTGQGVPQPGWFQEVDQYDYLARGPGQDGRADYQYMQGTSMACPQVAGMVALTREYYMRPEIHNIATPSNSLIRATLISGADRMNPQFPYPGYDQGWGRVNLKNSLYPDAPMTNQFHEGTITNTGTWDLETDLGFNLNINSGNVPLKATLVWIDSSGANLNRQMHLTATSPDGQTTYRSGWDNYDAQGWTVEGLNHADTMNTVQRIEIEEPVNGAWDFTLHATNIPSAANFAIVVSADFGPVADYQVDLQTDHPTTLSLVDGGSTVLPIDVRNWGNLQDDIQLTHNSNDITVGGLSTLTLATQEKQRVNVELTATTVAAGVYNFEITGTSLNDASAQDTIRVTIQVLDEQLPYREIAAGEPEDERWADVLTLEDSGGTPWIFITYLKDTIDGDRVFVKRSQLGSDGRPVDWSEPIMLDTGAGELRWPSHAQLVHVRDTDRVIVHWIGRDPNNIERTPAYLTYAEHGDWSNDATWEIGNLWANPIEIDYNSGSSTNNIKRCVYMLWRNDGSQRGELTYVFEHLDNDGTNIVGIGIDYRISTDGGESWSGASIVPGTDDADYFYFFPSGVTDHVNDVNWHFFYYREQAGNTRVVVVKLQEGGSWSGTVEIMGDSTDAALDNHNWQFPRAAHANVGGTNNIYVSSVYDHGGAKQDITAGAIAGNQYHSGNPPARGDFNIVNEAMGGEVVESGYMESFVLSMTTSQDADGTWAWTGYQETDTAFDVPNMDAGRSNDHYTTSSVDPVTRDNYAKLNPQMSSLVIGGHNYVYMTYHGSYGTMTDVDYQIYLSVFHAGYRDDPDTEGPMATGVSANPNPVESGHQFAVSATIDDTQTGFSNIAAAEYTFTATGVTDPLDVDWPGYPMSVGTGSAIEVAEIAGITSGDFGLDPGEHHVWVRGQDEHGNWGDEHASYTVLEIDVADALPPSIDLTNPIGGETFNAGNIVTIEWTTTPGDGTIIEVELFVSIDGGAFEDIATVPDGTFTYDWTVPDAHNDFTRIRARVRDDNALTDTDTSGGFSIIGIPPAAPASMDVQHTGTPGLTEEVDNGHFVDGYTPEWALTVLQNHGVADWDVDGYQIGGSVYVYTGVAGENQHFHQEAYWEQSITAQSGELDVSFAFQKYVYTETGGPGNNNPSYVHTATARLDVWDTGTGAWETVLQHTTTASSVWTELSGIYTPVGEVNAVRAYAYAEAEGDGGAQGGGWEVTAEALVAMDAVSVQSYGEASDDDNLITWNRSAEDPDKVTHYQIYRSDTETGIYENIATVSADGSASYQYIDVNRGTADEILWWYQVYSDTNGLYSDESIGPVQEPCAEEEPEPDPTFDILLTSGGAANGWNFVSFNLDLADTNLETILAGIDGNYSKVMYYDAAAGQWQSYVPGRAAHFNNLGTWNHHMGLWIHATVDDTLTVEGSAPVSTDITLYPGWNMVGLPSDTIGNHGLPAEVSRIGYFDATATYNMAYNYNPATFEFNPGQGYMVYLDHTEPLVWTVNY